MTSGLKRNKEFSVVLCNCVHSQNFSHLVWAFTLIYKNTWHVCSLQPKFVALLWVTVNVCGVVWGHSKSSRHGEDHSKSSWYCKGHGKNSWHDEGIENVHSHNYCTV